jgi:tetraacyldisaccharide 4'-kinase
MGLLREEDILRIMSGERRGLGASLLRGMLRAVEPIYSGIVTLRNKKYDAGYGVTRLPRPVVSVGNLTAGGTGKTPVVSWLCKQLRTAGCRPAVLMRGFKSNGGVSDEQRMLKTMLNGEGESPIVVHADPDRVAGGLRVLKDHPEVDAFVLDDGFQHRRLARDFDLVLISATEPWGFGHVHPRGLLREPIRGLARADAVLITHADEVPIEALALIEERIRRYTRAPIYHANHVQTGLRSAASDDPLMPIEELRGKAVYAFCGIGNPESFFRQVETKGARIAGRQSYADHYQYRGEDVVAIDAAAGAAGAQILVTTEKDWARLAPLPEARQTKVPLSRVQLTIRFDPGHEDRFLSSILARCRPQNVKSPSIAVQL